MHKQISSLQNPLVKQVLLLQEKSRERKKTGLFVIEGIREVQLALKGSYEFEFLLFCPEIVDKNLFSAMKESISTSTEVIEISSEVYQKLAYRSSTEGVLAIAKMKTLALSKLDLPKENALILVAEAPEKPGNIGALLRTADAARLDAVIIANPKTDM
ncbi:MAG: RNA methyltransferase, partial [Flavobacteriaceae bacterium]|nr:RNA methyltransferase [Flavobacteriaceae bacterium]